MRRGLPYGAVCLYVQYGSRISVVEERGEDDLFFSVGFMGCSQSKPYIHYENRALARALRHGFIETRFTGRALSTLGLIGRGGLGNYHSPRTADGCRSHVK